MEVSPHHLGLRALAMAGMHWAKGHNVIMGGERGVVCYFWRMNPSWSSDENKSTQEIFLRSGSAVPHFICEVLVQQDLLLLHHNWVLTSHPRPAMGNAPAKGVSTGSDPPPRMGWCSRAEPEIPTAPSPALCISWALCRTWLWSGPSLQVPDTAGWSDPICWAATGIRPGVHKA